MPSKSVDGLTLLQFERLSQQAGIVHAFVSRPHNYAPHRGVGREQAVQHRRRVCELLGLDFDKLTSPAQVHGGEVVAIEASDVGCGREGRDGRAEHGGQGGRGAVRFVDGLVSNLRGVPLILMSADCPLVCAYDPLAGVIGAVHASWQGTVAYASAQMIRVMRQLGAEPVRMLAAIAPSAGPCCYQVGPDVRRIARTKLPDADRFFPTRDGRMTFDLWAANREQLQEAGVPAAQIEVAGMCSLCDTRFWSHRRDGADAGRSALFIALT